MEYINLEIGLKILAVKFKTDLKNELEIKHHIKTGDLEKSIEFKIKRDNDKYILQLESLEYIKYLDEGKFLDKFMKDKEIELEKELPKYIKKDILTQFNNL